MRIQENKIQKYDGTSFKVVKQVLLPPRFSKSVLIFENGNEVENEEYYAEIMLGNCENCDKLKELYKDFTYDKVLVLGLGLGLLAETLKVEKECSVVDVVENNKELIDYVNFIDESINVVEHDAFTYKPAKKYDLILVDLWWGHEDITEEILNNIENNYKTHLEENGRILIPILYKSFKK
jgi:hypothetical protein